MILAPPIFVLSFYSCSCKEGVNKYSAVFEMDMDIEPGVLFFLSRELGTGLFPL